MMKYRVLEEKFIHSDNEFIPQYRNDLNVSTDKDGEYVWYSFFNNGVRIYYTTYDEALTHLNKYHEKMSGPYETKAYDVTI